jgi:drug/metabolite transporter (DMT)-like permease
MARRAVLALAGLLAAAVPAAAAERVPPTSGPEWIAFVLFLGGSVAFFAWVAWLAWRRHGGAPRAPGPADESR